MKHYQGNTLLAAAAFATAIVSPIPALGADNSSIEEIIVTATRVESSLKDTAIAVSAFTTNTMDEMNITDPMDYEALVPSLSIQLSPNRTSIRGVGRFANTLGVAPGVAMYEDGAYNQENTALGSNPLNTERVEILRGPQGTLFGRNTTGGSTNIIKRRPTDVFTLDSRIGVGNFGRQEYELFVGGPMTDTLRGKIYYNRWFNDGLYANKGGHDTNGATKEPNYYTEWMVDWKPTDNLYVLYKGGMLAYSYYQGGTSFFTPYDGVNYCTSTLDWCNIQYAQVQNGIDEPLDTWTIDVDDVGEQELNHHLSTTLHVIYDFENLQMKYIGYHNHYDWDFLGVDYDGTSNPDHGAINDIKQYQRITTHEITFHTTHDKPLQWIAGAYYLDDENWQPWGLYDRGENADMVNIMSTRMWEGGGGSAPLTTADIIGQNPKLIYYLQDATFWNDNWSVFGEANYAFNERWKLTLGARYSVDHLKGKEQQWVYGDSFIYIDPAWWAGWCPYVQYYAPGEECVTRGAMDYSPSATPRVSKKTYRDTSGRAIVEYRPDDDNLMWFTISNAFKVGGMRVGSLQGLSTGESPFFPGEEVTMYELGWKGTLSPTLNIETVGFYYDYRDMQQQLTYRNEFGVSMTNVTNIDATMYGVEAQVTWLPVQDLMLFITYSYNHAQFSEHLLMREENIELHCDATNAQGDCLIDAYGNRLDITPEQKFAFNALYTIQTGIGEIALGGTWSYVGDRYFDIFNSPELKGDAYNRIDLDVTWTSRDSHWQVKGWAKNVTDEEWFNTKGVGANSNPVAGARFPYTKYLRYSGVPANPRLYMVELRYRI